MFYVSENLNLYYMRKTTYLKTLARNINCMQKLNIKEQRQTPAGAFFRRAAVITILAAGFQHTPPLISVAHAETSRNPLEATELMHRFLASIDFGNKDALDVIKSIHTYFRADGPAGIKRDKTRNTKKDAEPRTTVETEKSGGDCSELSYHMLAALSLALDGRVNVKLGAFEIHIKGDPQDIWHVVPFAVTKDKTELAIRDKRLADNALRILGLDKDWYVVFVDPQAKQIGVLEPKIDAIVPTNMEGAKAMYFREHAMASAAKGNIDEALVAFKQAGELNPHDYVSLENVRVILTKQGKTEDAHEFIERIAKRAGDDPNIKQILVIAKMNMALKLGGETKYNEAVKYIEQALELDPKNRTTKETASELYNNYGIQLSNEGKIEEAKRAFERAVALNPKNKIAKKNLGIISKR